MSCHLHPHTAATHQLIRGQPPSHARLRGSIGQQRTPAIAIRSKTKIVRFPIREKPPESILETEGRDKPPSSTVSGVLHRALPERAGSGSCCVPCRGWSRGIIGCGRLCRRLRLPTATSCLPSLQTKRVAGLFHGGQLEWHPPLREKAAARDWWPGTFRRRTG